LALIGEEVSGSPEADLFAGDAPDERYVSFIVPSGDGVVPPLAIRLMDLPVDDPLPVTGAIGFGALVAVDEPVRDHLEGLEPDGEPGATELAEHQLRQVTISGRRDSDSRPSRSGALAARATVCGEVELDPLTDGSGRLPL